MRYLLFFLPFLLAAQSGSPMLPADPLSTFQSYGANSVSVVPVSETGLPFTQAIRVVKTSTPGLPYSGSVYWAAIADAQEGDLLVATFWIKNGNQNREVLRVLPAFQSNQPPNYSKALYANAPDDLAQWTRYAIPFRADQLYSHAGNGSSFQLFFGSAAQTFEVGGISIENYGQVADPISSSLASQFAFYYPGRGDSQASWRQKALANIELFRKAFLIVQVLNPNGTPIPAAQVNIDQTRSAFGWGSAVGACRLVGNCLSAGDQQNYTAAVSKFFNVAVMENDLKWPDWEANRQQSRSGVAWLKDRGLLVRGHNLIWPNFSTMPSDTASLSPDALRTRIDNHFYDELGTLSGQLYEWDVVNEPYSSNQVQGLIPGVTGVTPEPGVLGNPEIVSWYQLAASIDPNTKRYLNDYAIFEQFDPVHESYDLALLQYIAAGGGNIQGFGFQSHFDQSGPVFSDMQRVLADFDPLIGEYGVTEFDFTTVDEQLAADLTQDFMTFIFGQPKFHEFLMWGFWDGAQWRNSAPLFRQDWTLKPSGAVFERLTQRDWQTHRTVQTFSDGGVEIRAFKGSYTITAAVGGKICSLPVELNGNTKVTIVMNCQ